MFADNLVPHVLRLDGVLWFDPELVARIERGELIEHGSPEEVEIRACAVHAVELLVAAASESDARPPDRGADRRDPLEPRSGPGVQGGAAPPLAQHRLLTRGPRYLAALARSLAIALAPVSPTSSSGRSVPLESRSRAG